MSDARILRDRHEDFDDDLDRAGSSPPDGCRSLLVLTTTVTTYPTVPVAFYAVLVVDVDGTETEGAPGNFSAQTATLYALNIGTAVPPLGTKVLADVLNGILVFRYDG